MNYTYSIIIKRVLPFAAVMVAFGVLLACTRMDDVSLPEASKGKQYTFHIGLDLSSVYKQITFTPSVSEWETKIYENNDDF